MFFIFRLVNSTIMIMFNTFSFLIPMAFHILNSDLTQNTLQKSIKIIIEIFIFQHCLLFIEPFREKSTISDIYFNYNSQIIYQMKETIQNQAEIIKKIKEHKNGKKQDKQQIVYDQASTNCTFQKIKQQIKKRQYIIEKLYKRSTVNKIYLFPKEQQYFKDISFSSHSSIQQMKTVQIYRLEQQNKKYNKLSDTLLRIEHPHIKQQNNLEKLEQKLRKIKMNSKKRLNTSNNCDSQTSLDSQGLKALNKSSGILLNGKDKLKKIQKSDKLIPTEKNIKNKKQVHFYQELNSNVDLKSKVNLHKPRGKNNSSVQSIKIYPMAHKYKTHISHNSVGNKSKENLQKQPFLNICVSKIFQKYNNKKSQRSRTQY